MSSIDKIEELTHRVRVLEEALAHARSQALADAAYCFERACKVWEQEGVTAFRTSHAALGYNEAARVLIRWANDPTHINDMVRKRDEAANSTPASSGSSSNGESPEINVTVHSYKLGHCGNRNCPTCEFYGATTDRSRGYSSF